MWRFLLPALAMMGAMTALFAGALGDLWLSPDLSNGGSAIIDRAEPEQAAPPSSSPTPVPVVSAPTEALLKEAQARDALQRQIAALHQQATSLQDGIADLQRQDSGLQTEIAQHRKQVSQRAAGTSAVAEEQATHDALQQQIAGLQRQVADLQRQDGSMQSQIAQHRQELTQTSQDLAQRSQELARSTEALTQQARDRDAVRAETDKLRQGIDTLGEQRRAEEASLARQRAQLAAVVQPRAAPPRPPVAPRLAQPSSIRQPRQAAPSPPTEPTPIPQPTQLVPAPPAVQQLETARQWLSAGRPDEARRILAMVQTQMIFQPVTPGKASAQGGHSSAADIGDAIRWLGMGASGQAMQSITRAIVNANPPNLDGNARAADGAVRAWSGYSADTPSGSAPPPSPGHDKSNLDR
jgi:hypothetical protein